MMMERNEASEDVIDALLLFDFLVSSQHRGLFTVQSSESAIVSGTAERNPSFQIPGDLFYQSIQSQNN